VIPRRELRESCNEEPAKVFRPGASEALQLNPG
jgi:hypothetical protein